MVIKGNKDISTLLLLEKKNTKFKTNQGEEEISASVTLKQHLRMKGR